MNTAPVATLRPPATRTDDSPRLRVVLIDEELPYPATSGKRIRTLNLVQRLAARHQLTYVCHRNADPAELQAAEAHFAALGVRTVVVERAVPPRSGVGFYARLAANLLSRLPYSVASHTSPALTAALRQLQQTEPVDLWHCEWSPYAEAIRTLPGRRVVMAHNVESVIWQRYYETEANRLKRWYIGRQWRKFHAFERDVLSTADLTVAVSTIDAERFRTDLSVPRVAVVDNGVDTRYFHPSDTERDPATLLFLGSLDWRPNLDAVQQLFGTIFPAVRAQVPEARLLLVGRNPPEWVRKAASETAGVELHASVPDVRPFLQRSTLMVVPLRIGGGSRLKILESLSAGLPVVSTRVGAEGLHLQPGQHLDVVDDVAGMADAVTAALADPLRTREQAFAGREQVLALYDWDVLAERLDRLWRRCAAGADIQGENRS
ncbi:MAG: glycosyltransferase [Gemmataceae bacterium]